MAINLIFEDREIPRMFPASPISRSTSSWCSLSFRWCLQNKQALRSKFLVTAKGWYWQTLLEIGCQPLFCESGCQPVHCTSALLYYAVKLFINLSYFSGCQPLYCTCSLVYWCTAYESCMCNVLSLSIPHFQNVYFWNTLWKEFKLCYLKWK